MAVTEAATITDQVARPDRVTIYGRDSSDGTLRPVAIGTDGRTAASLSGCYAEATFTPAASSHTAGYCNGAAGTFALSAPSGCVFMITDADLYIDSANAMATAWRLHLYSVTPPSAIADGAAWDIASGDRASYLGYVDLGTAVDIGSTQAIQNAGINRAIKLAGTSVFGYLVNLTTLTTEAVAHRVRLKGVPV